MSNDEDDMEGIDPNDELFATAPIRKRRLIGFDWNAGYVSPFQPTGEDVANKMMEMLKVGSGTVMSDLGSGDGTILLAAAKRGAHCIGFELSPDLNTAARSRADAANVGDRVTLLEKDFMSSDVLTTLREHRERFVAPALAGGDTGLGEAISPFVVVMYLLPDALHRLKPSIESWLRAGCWVATVRWQVAGRVGTEPFGVEPGGSGTDAGCGLPTPLNDGLRDGFWIYAPAQPCPMIGPRSDPLLSAEID